MKSPNLNKILALGIGSSFLLYWLNQYSETTVFQIIVWFCILYLIVFLYYFIGNTLIINKKLELGHILKDIVPANMKDQFHSNLAEKSTLSARILIKEILSLIVVLISGFKLFYESQINAGIAYASLALIIMAITMWQDILQSKIVCKTIEYVENFSTTTVNESK